MNRSKHKEKTVEGHLIKRIPIVKENATVKSVLSMLEKIENKYDSVDYIYVVDKDENLIGMFNIQEIFNNPKNTPIKNFIQKNLVTISLDTTLEKAAHLALRHNLKQIPVTKSKKLIGVVSTREIFSTINQSLKKDILHFAGIHKSHLEFENSLKIPIMKAVRNQLSWLIAGFVGAMIIAFYIGLFEETLSKYLIIASFVPAITYISDALGTQFQTMFVRDMAIMGKELNIKKYFLKQMSTGFIIAFIIGILMFSFISFIWSSFHVAFIISLACFIALIITSFTALFFTFLIKKLKFDPALGSGPVTTIISDLTSVVIYFIIVFLLI